MTSRRSETDMWTWFAADRVRRLSRKGCQWRSRTIELLQDLRSRDKKNIHCKQPSASVIRVAIHREVRE